MVTQLTARGDLAPLLHLRAELKSRIRQFFSEAGVVEVDVPAIAPTAVTDVHIDSIPVELAGGRQFLQSSPEYAMKRLLSAGSGSIYSLAYAYRNGEKGHRHRPEFTLLEWYRLDWDEVQLMDEVAQLLARLGVQTQKVVTYSYGDIFQQVTGLNPHQASLESLQQLAVTVCDSNFSEEPRSTCLDAIFSFQVEPQLPSGLVFVKNYPVCQSALATIDVDANGDSVARRFEAFLNRIELANGYFELTDAQELRQRFERDQAQRQAIGKSPMAIDESFMTAMERGLPGCAGVAMGFDRLLMQLLDCSDIADVLPVEHV